MRCAPWLLGSLTAALMVGCGGDRRNNDNSAAGIGTETGTMQGGAATTDTAMSSSDTSGMSHGMSSDTAHADTGMHDMNHSSTPSGSASRPTGGTADSAKGNQTKSGVTDTKTGKSTLGKSVTKTRPDQGQPVTSKGDTVSSGPDSTEGNQ